MPLARWHAKLNNWQARGMLASWHVHWHVKMRNWHAFGTVVHGHVDHAGTYGMHGTQFSKLL